MDHLEGYAWPNADTDRLRDAASTWRSAADDVEGLTTYCDSAVSQLETQDSPEVPLATQAVRDLRRAVDDLSCALRSVGDACDDYASGVDEHRAIIRAIVADMAVEAGLTLAAGAVIGFFTVGGGAAAGAAIAGWRIASAAKKILTALHALETLAKARAVARLASVVAKVRPLRKVLERLKSAQRLRKGEKPAQPGGRGLHHKPPRKPGDPLDPATRPPTAGANWEGQVTRKSKGEIWQRPGATRDADSVRIMEPNERYPYGRVIFTNSENQPLNCRKTRQPCRHAHPDQGRRHLSDPERMEPMATDPAGDLIASVTWKADVLRLEIDTKGGWFLAIDNDYTVEGSDAERLDSRTHADEAASAIQAHVGEAIAEFDFGDDGNLRMTIGAITVTVEPAYDYEAWHATGPPPEKHMIICLPGGGIA